jgi:hypothetical protein
MREKGKDLTPRRGEVKELKSSRVQKKPERARCIVSLRGETREADGENGDPGEGRNPRALA